MLERRQKYGFFMDLFFYSLLYLTFCPHTQSADKVNPAAKEVTVDLIVQGVWGCAMLLHIVITHSNWTQGSPTEKQPSVI